MAPIAIRDAPHASSGHQTLDIEERQFLHGYADDVHFAYHQRIALLRISKSRCVLATPTGDFPEDALEGEEVIPLPRNGDFPLAVRPYFGFGAMDEVELIEFYAAEKCWERAPDLRWKADLDADIQADIEREDAANAANSSA